MCRVLEVSESGYAAWRSRGESRHRQEDQCLTETIKTIHVQSRGTYGTPRVQAELQAQDKRVSRARIRRLMKASGLKVRQKRKFRNTTQPKHRHPVAPHLLERKFTATRPNQKWTADITYLPTTEGWLYLAVVLDLFSRKVVGWAMRETLHTEVVLSALGPHPSTLGFPTRNETPGILTVFPRGFTPPSTSISHKGGKHHEVVSQSFQEVRAISGPRSTQRIQVLYLDQHPGYGNSVSSLHGFIDKRLRIYSGSRNPFAELYSGVIASWLGCDRPAIPRHRKKQLLVVPHQHFSHQCLTTRFLYAPEHSNPIVVRHLLHSLQRLDHLVFHSVEP